MAKAEKLVIAGTEIRRGESYRLELQATRLYTDTNITIPVYVKRGKRAGPTLFLSAAIHGDELNGIEIINRVINSRRLSGLRGTLIAVPVVNVYGVIAQSRYLPDRRDLNRSFPGSPKGSLAARLANMFLEEIVSKADYGIDFHTGAIHRTNLPQIRADLDDDTTLAMARAFGVPVLLNSNLRDGSLRQCAADMGTPIILYEAGEALRFDELCIRAGVEGTFNVMRHLGMLSPSRRRRSPIEPVVARRSYWLRATDSGFVSHHRNLGDHIAPGDVLATINDPFGRRLDSVVAEREGIIIGKQNIPLVQEGEAMYHIASFREAEEVAEHIETMQDTLLPEMNGNIL